MDFKKTMDKAIKSYDDLKGYTVYKGDTNSGVFGQVDDFHQAMNAAESLATKLGKQVEVMENKSGYIWTVEPKTNKSVISRSVFKK